jgi:hypothetical protein
VSDRLLVTYRGVELRAFTGPRAFGECVQITGPHGYVQLSAFDAAVIAKGLAEWLENAHEENLAFCRWYGGDHESGQYGFYPFELDELEHLPGAVP